MEKFKGVVRLVANPKSILLTPELKIEALVKQMINSPEQQIILEVPAGVTLLTNEINLRLLKFYAEEEEKELIINSNDSFLISLAQRLEISTIKENILVRPEPINTQAASYQTVTSEIAAAPEERIYRPTNGSSWQGRFVWGVLVILFTLTFALWWFFQPQATVIVYPKEKDLDFTVKALLSSNVGEDSLTSGKIPAKLFEKNATLTAQTVSTGQKVIGITPAIGKVVFINNSNQPVVVPQATVLTGKEGVHFLTDKNILIPKKTTKYQYGMPVGEDYGQAEVTITAETKGSSGNQPAKSITQVGGNLQRFVRVVNLTPTRNGANKKIAVITLGDTKKGEAEVRQQMEMVGPEEAATLVGPGYLFLPQLVKLEIIRITNNPEIGAEGNNLQTTLEYQITTLAPAQDDINKLLLYQLDRKMLAGFQALNQKIELVSMRVSPASNGNSQLELVGRGQIRGILDQKKIRELIRGKSLADAKEVLTRQNEIAKFKISSPTAVNELPGFGFQIKVVFPAGGMLK